jgi:hypothetical protein
VVASQRSLGGSQATLLLTYTCDQWRARHASMLNKPPPNDCGFEQQSSALFMNTQSGGSSVGAVCLCSSTDAMPLGLEEPLPG